MAEVWKWCWIGLGAYAIRFLLYGISTSLSHISAYTILENIRLTLAQRLMKAPLGTVIGESVGKLKSVLVGLYFPFLEYTTANAIYFSADGGTITHYIDPHHLDRLELIQLVDPTARSHG